LNKKPSKLNTQLIGLIRL